jgi:glucose-6-phosphate 1-dehydrogenase
MEVMARFRKPPTTNMTEPGTPQNYMRFRISPEVTVAMAVSVSSPTGVGRREAVELVASRHPRPEEMEAYERVLGDAMAGDATLFARQDYVEEAWRIVDPILKAKTPLYIYEPHTWGPKEIDENIVPAGGWDEPQEEEQEDFRIIKQPAILSSDRPTLVS